MLSFRKILILLLLAFNSQPLISQSMEWLCRPGKFSDIKYMGYDLFKVKDINGKWGIFSFDGKEVVNVKYDEITSFMEDRAILLDKKEGRILGIVNQYGEVVKSFENEMIFITSYPYYKEGMLPYKDKSGLCGYINLSGNISIKARFYLAAPFQDGIATVQYTDSGGYYGLINKSGGSAIISDVKYNFLSSVVDGFLFSVRSPGSGGNLLQIMRLDGNSLKKVKNLESGMFVDLSDDFTYLVSQNGHHYFIDNQWRIKGANYDLKMPYTIDDKLTLVVETSELLSKQETKDGVQITFMGNPILENSFENVETYEKKYAIVSKDKAVGVLKLNPSAWIELKDPTNVFVFNHHPKQLEIMPDAENFNLDSCIELPVDIKDVNPSQLKCYINDSGYLYYAPLKYHNNKWRLYLPYFKEDNVFNNIKTNTIDIAITYDGLDWMHKSVRLSSKHEPGFDIQISGSNITDEKGAGIIDIIVQSINGISGKPVKVEISGMAPFDLKGEKVIVNFPVHNIPEGESMTYTYNVTVKEEGCPAITKQLTKKIVHPKRESNEGKDGKKAKVEGIIM